MGLMWVAATHPERIGTLVFAAARILPHRVAERWPRSRRHSAPASPWHASRALDDGVPVVDPVVGGDFRRGVAGDGRVWHTDAVRGDVSAAGAARHRRRRADPGAIGSYHEAYRIGVTTFFGASNEAAVAAAIVTHAVSYFPVVITGMIFMIQDGLNIRRLESLAETAREKEMPKTA
jgi:hypothetical protein